MPDLTSAHPPATALSDTLPARFWAKVDRRGNEECWPWLAAKTYTGYGVIWVGGTTIARAHRVAYALLRGPLQEGMTVDHLCRNPSCVNPAHMELVTSSENSRRARLAARDANEAR